MSTLELQIEKAEDKFAKRNDRTVNNFGYGDTDAALSIASGCVERLAEAVVDKIERTKALRANDPHVRAYRFIALLEPEVVAASALQTALHCVAVESPLLTTVIDLGKAIYHELWAVDLQHFDKELAARIDKAVRLKHGSLLYRTQAARGLAKRAGFKPALSGEWRNDACAIVGQWLLDLLLTTLPDIFEYEDGSEFVTISAQALHHARRACIESIRRHPVFLPEVEKPEAWAEYSRKKAPDSRLRSTSVVRTHLKETKELVRESMAQGTMAPALNALNAIQSVGFRINTPVLAVMKEVYERGIDIPDFPRKTPYEIPKHPKPWDEMADLERKAWKAKADETRAANRVLAANNISFFEDMETAERLLDQTFYTPCNLDWRGRVYPLPHFNFQREDRVRGLFLFEEGRELGENGLKWLKIHLANCGDFNKISKRSFEEREQWTNENLASILVWAEQPLSTLTWTKADKPFLFLAACIELSQALKSSDSSRFVSTLPVSWDGSCSGLQHLCAMTRSPEGAFVNLTPSPQPQDVYLKVADEAFRQIELDAAEGNEYAAMCLECPVDRRKMVKRNVMTYSYSSKKFGMGEQQIEDLMKPLRLKVLKGELPEHPFTDNTSAQEAAARYLAGRVHEAIERVVRKPAEAMEFLQKLARACAHEDKPLEWTTPVGLPWSNRYHDSKTRSVRLFLHDRGIRIQSKVAIDYEAEILKTRAVNGVAPNFVHALDAAHLMLTVNAAVSEAITSFALVHDSFGCHAGVSERFHQIIREQFVQMYEEHDVLNEVYERAKYDVSHHNWRRLPKAIEYGDLNIQEVINAKYAFA